MVYWQSNETLCGGLFKRAIFCKDYEDVELTINAYDNYMTRSQHMCMSDMNIVDSHFYLTCRNFLKIIFFLEKNYQIQ